MNLPFGLLSWRKKLNLRPWMIAAVAVSFATITTKAEEAPEGWVEVRRSEDIYKSYSERRETHGWQFAFGTEIYKPDAFISTLGDGATYEQMFGNADMSFFFVEGGYKFNFGPMSLSGLLSQGTSSIEDSKLGQLRSLKVDRTAIKMMLIIDNVMQEPYVAPYVSLNLFRFGIDESAAGSDLSASNQTQMGTGVTVGLLLQLNWIEKDVASWAWSGTGLENTYIDIFMSQHGKTSSDNDPDASSSFAMGAGLRLEF